MHNTPTPDELLALVARYLTEVAMPQLPPAAAFHARVAANVLAMVSREITLGPAQAEAHARRLAEFGCSDDGELARAIRNGDLDARLAEVVAAVESAVDDKLSVANPRYFEAD